MKFIQSSHYSKRNLIEQFYKQIDTKNQTIRYPCQSFPGKDDISHKRINFWIETEIYQYHNPFNVTQIKASQLVLFKE